MIENTEQTQPEEENISISVEGDTEAQQPQDELDEYTKGVTKRINKLNQRNRQTEERAKQLESLVQQQDNELRRLRGVAQEQVSKALDKEEESLKAKEAQVDDIYRKAMQQGDADLLTKADSLKNEIAIAKEKVRVQKNKQQEAPQEQYVEQQQYQPQQQQPQPAQPTPQAAQWHERNSWYGDMDNEEHSEATQFAYFHHNNLIHEGYEPDSDDYYEALDQRIKRAYPNLASSGNNQNDRGSESTTSKPTVQRVAGASVGGGRTKTQGNNDGVRFAQSEIDRLEKLRPANMNQEAWLKLVAKEKLKQQQREAM